jgi:hypothetical protein
VAEESKPYVTTAAELDAMTPEQRRRHFEESLADPASLSPAQKERLQAAMDELIDRDREIAERRAS